MVKENCSKIGLITGMGFKRENFYWTVVTHNNKYSSILNIYKDNLILIEVDTPRIVNTMFDLLERLMKKEEIPDEKILIEPYLTRR